MNKEILFEDIKCGNLSAFEALFRQYYPSMCVIAGKLVANREVAEDIVQDVFIRLWEKKAEYDKIPDFRTFLYVAVRNLCYNYLRDKKKTIDFSQIELPDKQLSFQEQLIQEETYRLISMQLRNYLYKVEKLCGWLSRESKIKKSRKYWESQLLL